jgi:cell division protein FtsQ
MLTPGVLPAIRIGTPALLIAVIVAAWFTNPENRAILDAKIAQAKATVQHRPEFMVTKMEISGADPELATLVARVLPVSFPASSFDLDLEDMRSTVAALNAVSEARVRLGEGGVLQVDVTPRVPVAIWRDGQTLKMIDADGRFVGAIAARIDRLDLPLIAGDGAKAYIDEALALFRATGPLAPRVRGLVRMGERRWDMVLDRDQRILLPENDARDALDRVIALSEAHDLLNRDVTAVDMRNGNRATVRMNSEAAAAMRRVSDTGASQ